MNSPHRIPSTWFHPRRKNRGLDRAIRTAVDTRQIQTVHGSSCICHRCRPG